MASSYKLIFENIINDPNVPEAQKIQEKKYKAYIDNHKKNVVETWEELKKNKTIYDYIMTQNQKENIENIETIINKNVKMHDNSKYGEEEWEPYRKHFYSVNEEEKKSSKKDFGKAWEHHKKVNTHHHEHWEEINKNNEMPLTDVVEMCCDWISMSKVLGGTALTWYKSQNNIFLGDKQKEWTLFILNEYYKEK